MGWTFDRDLSHLQSYINRRLRDLTAVDVSCEEERATRWVNAFSQDETSDPLDVFFLYKGQNGDTRIAVMLIDRQEPESGDEKRRLSGQSIPVPDSGPGATSPVDSAFVQVWGDKIIDAEQGPIYHNCPPAWLALAPSTGPTEDRWRRRIGERTQRTA